MTFWQVGVKVWPRFVDVEGEIIAVEESKEPYRPNGFSDYLIRPEFPIEWCKVKFADGRVQEYAGHELRVAV